MVWGLGMLVGSIIMSSWKGTPATCACARSDSLRFNLPAGLIIAGLRPSPFMIAGGMFFAMIFIPLASGLSQAVFQTKIRARGPGTCIFNALDDLACNDAFRVPAGGPHCRLYL
jgi:hypothetical protein